MNLSSTPKIHMARDDGRDHWSHHVSMAASSQNWFLQEWFACTQLKQNDLVTKLGLHKQTASRLWHDEQPYRRDFVNQISTLLNIKPYELLMHPDEAMQIRRLQAAIAGATSPDAPPSPAAPAAVMPIVRKVG